MGQTRKLAILKRYLVDKVPISDLCDEYGIKPNQIYTWQKILFDHAETAFQQAGGRPASKVSAQEEKIARLENKLQQKNEVICRTDGGERPRKKSQWGTLKGRWVPHDTRDEVVDYVRRWNERTEIPAGQFIGWLGITSSKFHDWRNRYGKVNEHNAWIPRDWWLEDWEKQAIIRFSFEYPLEGYRRLAFMMLDRDVAAASPSSVYRVLKAAGRIGRSTNKPSKKGTGFHQPHKTPRTLAHRHQLHQHPRHVLLPDDDPRRLQPLHRALGDSPLDDGARRTGGASAGEREVSPRNAADHQRQRVAVFGEGLQGVHSHLRDDARANVARTTRKATASWSDFTAASRASASAPGTPISLEDALRIVGRYVDHYNQVRLHSAIGYVAPADKLAGREGEIFAARDRKLAEARERRKAQREATRLQAVA